MQRKTIALYLGVLICALAFFLISAHTTGVHGQTSETGYSVFSVSAEPYDAASPSHFSLSPVQNETGTSLCFFSNHQEVHVYADGVEIYSLSAPAGSFVHTTGPVWNFVPLPAGSQPCTVTVDMLPLYSANRYTRAEFYLGDAVAVYQHILRSSMPELSLGGSIIIVGLLMILYWAGIAKHTKRQSGLGWLGICSVLLGAWVFNETDAAALLLANRPASTTAAFLLLMLLPIPFILYITESFHIQYSLTWKILCGISLSNIITCSLLQIAGIADFHETVIFTHAVLLLSMGYLLSVLVVHISQRRVGRDVIVHLIGIAIMLLGIILDMVAFYHHIHATDLFGGISFLLYTVMLGVLGTRDSVHSIEQGKTAEIYRQMALYDSLTDMLSRAAYDHDILQQCHPTSSTAVVEFDLNDLKLHNDELGHSAGDSALSQAAMLIRNVFNSHGRCYRIGGDEFCAVIEHDTPQHLDALLQALRKSEARLNDARTNEHIPIEIACGYAFFDSSRDATLEDTRARADESMYANKQSLKHGRTSVR